MSQNQQSLKPLAGYMVNLQVPILYWQAIVKGLYIESTDYRSAVALETFQTF